jgi:hypothetical protein
MCFVFLKSALLMMNSSHHNPIISDSQKNSWKGFWRWVLYVSWLVAFDVPPYLCIHPHTCCNVIEKLQWLVGLEQVALPLNFALFYEFLLSQPKRRVRFSENCWKGF